MFTKSALAIALVIGTASGALSSLVNGNTATFAGVTT